MLLADPCASLQQACASSASGFATGGRPVALPRRGAPGCRPGPLCIEARYRGRNTDRSQVAQFQRSAGDTGSTEVQVARLQARVLQLTDHLKEHKHDFSTERGLQKLLTKRRHFLLYLYKHNRPKYDELILKLGIRPVKIQAARGVFVKLQAASRTAPNVDSEATKGTI